MGLDPTYLADNSNVVWYGTETYTNAVNALKSVTGKSETGVEMMLNAKYGVADYWSAVEALKDEGVIIAKNTNGYNCFAYSSDVTMTAPSGPMAQIDSNATTTTLVKASPVYDVVVDDVPASTSYGKVLTNKMGSVLTPQHGFYGWDFFAVEGIQALQAAGWGISLGKTIDDLLYNANPDFWDSHGMSSLNPETWNSITNGDDSFAAHLFNMVFGLNPNTGEAQMFVDERALAYLSAYMYSGGVFAEGAYQEMSAPITVDGKSFSNLKKVKTSDSGLTYRSDSKTWHISNIVAELVNWSSYSAMSLCTRPMFNSFNWCTVHIGSNTRPSVMIVSDTYFQSSSDTNAVKYYYWYADGHGTGSGNLSTPSSYTYDNKTVYYVSSVYYNNDTSVITGGDNSSLNVALSDLGKFAWAIQYGSYTDAGGGVEGIGTQEGATTPNTTGWDDYDNVLPSLQQQYPDMWANAVPNTITQPDGSVQTITYVPVALPNASSAWDTQPTSSTTTQSNPEVDPIPDPTPENNDLLKLVLQLITQAQPQPDPNADPQTQTQPDVPNMPNTGTGDSPTPVAPSGSASALWSVYHPTQAQINSFGAWLWGSPFLTDIGKLFQNPIDGVISLHKIYAPPVDAGSGTIVVGTLDSEVPSATVTQQYVTVNCGSVDCQEEFGSVFDYPPHTKVSLYLPFIGIVDLDTNDVMRSTINVTYGVDVFTGACLAMVEVTRDGNTVNLYQYAGVCAVSYPLGNVQQSQLFSGLLAIAGGVAATIASGGVGAPAALAVVGGAGAAAKTSIGRSGGFSGNAGAMGIKKPYLILQRPQTKVAETFPALDGYPTNISGKLSDFSGQVNVKSVHVEGINATDIELKEIEALLKSGVLV